MRVKTFSTDSSKGFRHNWETRTQDGFDPAVAIIFSSIDIDIKEVTGFLKDREVEVFGCSSCGEFLYDDDGQTITEGGLVCLMLDLLPGSFRIRSFTRNESSSFELGSIAGEWVKQTFENPAVLVLASGLNTDGEQLVRGIQHITGDDITMFGGMAGDDARFKQTYVFSEHGIDTDGAILMALDKNQYQINGIATSGWVSVGADKIVTRSEGNIVYTIDDQPALEVYKEYLNVKDDDLPEIGVEYPLMIRKPGSLEVLRAVSNVDKEHKALIFAGTVPTGCVVTFSSSPGFEIIDYTRKKVNDFHQENPDADFLILFSCMARHNALGPTISEEIDEAWISWRKPLVGFFTYGEIGSNFNAACDFHNETFTMVSIKERNDAE